jgi:undecaprenyl-diphosphatase
MDLQIAQEVVNIRTEWANTFFGTITNLGNTEIALLIFALILLLFLIKKRYGYIFLLTGSLALSAGIGYLLKEVVARPRPAASLSLLSLTDFSFPSGHTLIAFGFYWMAAYLLVKMVDNINLKTGIWIAWQVLAFLIAFSRIYLGVHWFTDVLGSIFIAIIINYLLIRVYHYRYQIRDFLHKKKPA